MTEVRDLVRSDRRLTVTMISSLLSLNRQTVHEILTFELGMQKIYAKLVPKILTNEQKDNRIFGQKRYFSGSAVTIPACYESTWLLPFPKTQIPPRRSSFWNCGQHPKGRDRPAEGTSTWRLPALLSGVGATSPALCGFSRELFWRGWCWFIVKMLHKRNIAPVSLLSWRNTSTTTFPRSPSHNWTICRIVECAFLSPVHINPCPLLSVIVLHLFTRGDDRLNSCPPRYCFCAGRRLQCFRENYLRCRFFSHPIG